MKVEEQQKARELRRNGESIKVIAKELDVSKSSVSRWVEDIDLTSDQQERLFARSCRDNGKREKCRVAREQWRTQGRQEADRSNWLHVAGCMLYWAEGWRKNNRNVVSFSNSDANMMRLFVRFLRECYGVKDEQVSIFVNCYTDIHSAKECEDYWVNILGMKRNNIYKTVVNNRSSHTKKRHNGTLEYGTCTIKVGSTEILQRIYGSLQEYAGYEVPRC